MLYNSHVAYSPFRHHMSDPPYAQLNVWAEKLVEIAKNIILKSWLLESFGYCWNNSQSYEYKEA